MHHRSKPIPVVSSVLLLAALSLTVGPPAAGAPVSLEGLESTAIGLAPIWKSVEADETFRLSWGDWDNDGDLDLAVASTSPFPSLARVYENDGMGTSSSLSLVWTATGLSSVADVAWGDWDNDGDLDLAVATFGTVVVFENDGLGLTTSLTSAWTSTEGDLTASVAWEDWDGDGDLDLAAGNYESPSRVYENDGLGLPTSLSLAWTAPHGTDATLAVSWGDWDGDGDPDLAVANLTGSSRVYENDGLGTAASLVEVWDSGPDGATDAAWGDWNGDGDPDLALGGAPSTLRVYDNDGLGLPTSLTLAWTASLPDNNSVDWGDMDGDGVLDLVASNLEAGTAGAWIYGNDGMGTASSMSPIWSSPHDSEGTKGIALGDWDNDGDLDLAAGNSGWPGGSGDVNRVYENQGFIEPWSRTGNGVARVAVGVQPTADGGFLVAGYTADPTAFWNARLDRDGLVQWQQTIGAEVFGRADVAYELPDGSAIVSGAINDPSVNSLFVGRVSSGGTIIWQRAFGSYPGLFVGPYADLSADGSYIQVGSPEFGYRTLDLDGNVIVQYAFQHAGAAMFHAIEATSDGGAILCGQASASSLYRLDCLKVDSAGGKLWEKGIGNLTSGVLVDSLRESPTGGFFLLVNGDWVIRLDAYFNAQWQRRYVATGTYFRELDVTADGGAILVGDAGVAPEYAVALRLDAGGNVVWQRAYDNPLTSGYAGFAAVATVPAGGFVVSGSDSGALWVARLDDDGLLPACPQYTGSLAVTATDTYETVYDWTSTRVEIVTSPADLGHAAAATTDSLALECPYAACIDLDGDGYGDPGTLACPNGLETDCDDGDLHTYPGAAQLCDGVNNNCLDGSWPAVPPTEIDDDGDGQAECAGDCDDADPLNFRGNPEVCDGLDNDCSGVADNGGVCPPNPPVAYALLWSSAEVEAATDVDWGDWDNDGDLDLAVANQGGPARIYENDGLMTPTSLTLAWTSTGLASTLAVAWADWDGNGTLDLAVGTDAANVVFANDGLGTATSLTPVWTSAETDSTRALDWADWDRNGTLDLAAGNAGSPCRVYANDGLGTATSLSLAWSSSDSGYTVKIAWGDANNDGYPELAVANLVDTVRLYENHSAGPGRTLFPVWSSDRDARSVAWGDWNGDGRLDLAVGFYVQDLESSAVSESHVQVYANSGIFLFTSVWSSLEIGTAADVEWGDLNDDGYPDLVVGDESGVLPGLQIYFNDGTGTPTALSVGWSSSEFDAPQDLALGDSDGDGDLEIAVGNAPNRVYALAEPCLDGDGDGFGLPGNFLCPGGAGPDCDDGDATIYPGATQLCDGINTDCLDGWWPAVPPDEIDDDGDGQAECAGDCDDADPLNFLGNPEVCDAHDNDCSAVADDGNACPPYPPAPVWSSAETDATYQIAWGDWDNDGDLDLATGGEGVPARVYENDGLGTPTSLALAWSSTGLGSPYAVAWGDWDGNGTLDLAVGTDAANVVFVNDGLGTATSLTPVWTSAESDLTVSVAWADWDGNGTLDLAAGNYGTADRVYANDGLGTATSLTLAWSSPIAADATVEVAWGDWDGNGTPDLAVAGEGSPIRVYENDGLGTATSLGAVWASATTNARSVAWGDWDGNGTLDLAAAFLGANQIYANDGLGTATSLTPAWSSTENDDTFDVDWGDLNGDGILDLVVGNIHYLGPNVRLYVNDGLGTGTSLTLDWSSAEQDDGTKRVALGDWDNDGDLDVATGNAAFSGTGAANRVYENGSSLFRQVVTLGHDARTLAWGDVDDDGDLDLAVGSSTDLYVYENDGLGLPGSLVLAWSPVAPYGPVHSVAWADALNDDGLLDLAVARNNGVWLCPGPSFGMCGQWVSGTPRDVAWGDLDGDGSLEFATGGWDNQIFTPSSPSPVWEDPDKGCKNVAWGDWDDDGDLDLAAACGDQTHAPAVLVYENVGPPLYLTLKMEIPEQQNVTDVAWGDWDHDGDLDLAISGTPGRVYENDGLGLPTSLQPVWSDGFGATTEAVAWDDWNGDGNLDLLLGSRLFANDGAGTAGSLVSVWSSPDPTSTLAWGDWDGDGDLDVAAGDSGGTVRVYENTLVHRPAGLPDGPLHPAIGARPDGIPAAAGFSTPRFVFSPVSVPYKLFDQDSDPANRVIAEYSVNGGGLWFPATPGPGGDGLTDLAASPAGSPHVFSWDAAADGAFSDNVVFRISVRSQTPALVGGPLQHGRLTARSASFRVVRDTDGDGVADRWDNCPNGFNPSQNLADAGDRVWLDADGDGIQTPGESGFAGAAVLLYDQQVTDLHLAASQEDGSYSITSICPGAYILDVILPGGYSLTAQNQGSDDTLDSDVDPATRRSGPIVVPEGSTTDLDIGVISGCTGPDEPVYISSVATTADGNDYPILTFQDPNQPAQVTGYNIYRSDDAGAPPGSWQLVASDVVDMDEATPNKQWVDTSGDVSPTGVWFYRVLAYSGACLVEGP